MVIAGSYGASGVPTGSYGTSRGSAQGALAALRLLKGRVSIGAFRKAAYRLVLFQRPRSQAVLVFAPSAFDLTRCPYFPSRPCFRCRLVRLLQVRASVVQASVVQALAGPFKCSRPASQVSLNRQSSVLR